MKHVSMKLSAVALGAVLALGGCTTDPAPAGGGMAMPVMMGCTDKDATHVVTGETPVYTTVGQAPVGTVKAGTKILSMVPGTGEYTKCTIAEGKSVYIKTAMLKPTTN
ncbi:MAG: hypothetical protein ACAI43_15480 [Phycisphaerae bacterium]|nr:hypothetical protein [Tepidisphaeraceae bacterium]